MGRHRDEEVLSAMDERENESERKNSAQVINSGNSYVKVEAEATAKAMAKALAKALAKAEAENERRS